MTLPVLDIEHLDKVTFGDAALRADIVRLFRGQAIEILNALRAAPDAEVRRRLAHTLKGSARGVGALRIAEDAAAIEAAALEGAPGDVGLERLADAIRDTEAAFEQALAELRS